MTTDLMTRKLKVALVVCLFLVRLSSFTLRLTSKTTYFNIILQYLNVRSGWPKSMVTRF